MQNLLRAVASALSKSQHREDSMKIVRYGQPHQEKPGILDSDGNIHDLSGIVPEIAGQTLSPATLASLKSIELAKLPNVSGAPRFGPCVGRAGKFVCIGLNYSDHAAEAGMRIPSEPVSKLARRDGQHFDCATWLHRAREMPKEQFKQEVERELTGRGTEPWEIIYFKLYQSQRSFTASSPASRPLAVSIVWILSNLEVHHQRFRSQSGHDSEQNLITLCTLCHTAEHV